MPPAKKESIPADEQTTAKKKDRAAEIADTFEWLITAFILAFVFRAFVMEAFRIPTGSMADTLKGAHFRLRCPQCGHQYEHGFNPREYALDDSGKVVLWTREYNKTQLQEDTVPRGRVPRPETWCPNCGNCLSTNDKMPVANGDRILVLKCIYQFFEPKRWDVVVFKCPNQPHINYIKRLVALPGDSLEIIDGDVYINGRISRKPPKVQQELWMVEYDNDYQPVNPSEPNFSNEAGSQWITTDPERPTLLQLDSTPDQINTVVYDRSSRTSFRTAYAYNEVEDYGNMPVCSDLMVRLFSRADNEAGNIGISLSKYGTTYKASVDPAGEMTIASVRKDVETILVTDRTDPPEPNKWTLVRFANVDHQLIFEFGDAKISHDLGLGPLAAGERKTNIEPQVAIFGSGRLTLSHVAIFRDIHYTAGPPIDGLRAGRAAEGYPFVLEKDEFFMLGDNSPNSADSRFWPKPDKANKGLSYRAGVVPRDYLVGKALFVYWPSGFRPFDKFPIAAVPNIGKMRFIYGGKD